VRRRRVPLIAYWTELYVPDGGSDIRSVPRGWGAATMLVIGVATGIAIDATSIPEGDAEIAPLQRGDPYRSYPTRT
jgi:hypothetical protein